MAINNTYSYKSFKRQSFLSTPTSNFNNTEIYGTNFSQDNPFTNVFPAGMTGVTFYKCNLNNCNIPAGNTISGGTNKHIMIQNDQEYWVVNSSLEPIEPRDKTLFQSLGLSTNPNQIPEEPLEEPITLTNHPKRKKIKDINSIANNNELLEKIVADNHIMNEINNL